MTDTDKILSQIKERFKEQNDRINNLEKRLEGCRWEINVLFGIVIFVLIIIIYLLCDSVPAKAATIDMRDDSLGGFSYMMDCLEKNDIPEDYKKILRMWHPAYNITQDEYDILVRITEAEATGGNHEQKMNVASCVLARVEAPQWPDNIEDVVFQKQQFTPIWDGRYFTVKIQDSTKKAVDEVLKFGKTHDCLWFCSDGSYNKKNEKGEYCSYHRLNHTWVFFDGEHHYFYD
ncbi:MAG: cell wall hydrolase [Pseudobutyrivibrio sp.]|nr:cell wall hydrolase [Pseudobutyrivibrio sp.]